ncbi:MAG: response regulator [Pseudolabrys sp.]|nr:response regulator [Pseudolabrys sp.]
MRVARAGTVRFLHLLMIGSIALPVTLFAYASALNYNRAFVDADERIDRSLAVLRENATNIFQSSELLLNAANDLIGRQSDEDIVANERALHDVLEDLVKPLTSVESIWIFGANGVPLVSSRFYPVPKSFANVDRDYFKAQVERDVGPYVGEVVPPKVPGQEIFVVSKRRQGPAFRGVVAVAIQPVVIQRFYQAIGTLDGSYFALLRNDGSFLARHPAPAVLGLKLNAQSTTMREIAVHPERGINSLTSQTDSVDRRMGYQRLAGYPVYLLAGVDRSAILHSWQALMMSHLVFGLPATAIMFGALYFALRRTRRLYREAEAREVAENALRQSQKMDAIGQLTGGVAHDFNNLLTIILGNLDSARRAIERGIEKTGDRAIRAIENATQGAQRAATLTQRLLAFSRQQPLAPAVVDVNAAVRDASQLLRRALGEAYDVEIVCAAGAWNIEVDRSQLDVALLNLVVNARDAMEEGGKVTIETGNAFLDDDYCSQHAGLKPGQYALIAVTDKGSGMPHEVAARAFDPFFTTKPAGRGTGLGLSQAYGFVKQSGGHISLYSELGHGTTVKMYFPRAYRAADGAKANPARDETHAGQGQTVLVVEDDEELRNYVVETLRDLNYSVEQASSSEDALKIFADGRSFDALLTDVVMPGLNGRQLADRVVKLRPDIKVLYMTGYSQNAIIHHGRLDPGVQLLQKPFSRNELAAQFAKLFGAGSPQ